MRKVLVVLFFNFILLNGMIWKVPETDPSIPWVINNCARPGDTISVWIRTSVPPDTYYENIDFRGMGIFVVNRSFLPGKTFYYKIKEDYLKPIFNGNHPPRWKGVKYISGSRRLTSYDIEEDNSGYPWIVAGFSVVGHPLSVKFTKWSIFNYWKPFENTPLWAYGSYLDFIFDNENRLFLIYHVHDEQNHRDIYSSRYDPITQRWEEPKLVNTPDTNRLDDFYPRIAIGGGEIWATWFDKGDSLTSNIKASRWNEERGEWEREMIVNPDTGGINRLEWFPDITVDANGTPHIVWLKDTPNRSEILYSRYENGRWIEPIYVANPDTYIPAGAYAVYPKIVVDNENNLHIIFTAGIRNERGVGILYIRRDANGEWKSPVMVTERIPGDPSWYSDIAVSNSNNIWIAFDRGNGSHWKVYAAHFNGERWEEEQRIDDGITYRGGFPKISLAFNECPFVIWGAAVDSLGQPHIEERTLWYNNYEVVEIKEEKADHNKIFNPSQGKNVIYNIKGQKIEMCKYSSSGIYFIKNGKKLIKKIVVKGGTK